MGLHHHHHGAVGAHGSDDDDDIDATAPAVRRALWIALMLNAGMFALEIVGGLAAGSVSLLADSVDFAGDAASYGISLAVLGMAPVWRSRAALLKAASMGLFGIVVLARALWLAWNGQPPEALTMGVIGVLAFAVNLGVAWLLYRFRDGDANLRSVWLCSRNDALASLAILAAAAGVFGTGRAWPDLVVAGIMAALAISASVAVLRHARKEMAQQVAARR
jgi:Co/Zn/Cd efflux system component